MTNSGRGKKRRMCGESVEVRSGRDVEPEGLDWCEALGKLFVSLVKTSWR